MRPHEVRLARERLGLSQPAFADALGLENAKGYARRTVSDWESGRRVIPGPVSLAIEYLLVRSAK